MNRHHPWGKNFLRVVNRRSVSAQERLLFREKDCSGEILFLFSKTVFSLKPKEGADQDFLFFAKEEQNHASKVILIENYEWGLEGK